MEFRDNVPVTNKRLHGFYEIKKKKERKGRFLNKYFKLCEFTSEHLPAYFEFQISVFDVEVASIEISNKETMHTFFKFMSGTDSVAFDKLPEEDFEKHYDKTLDIACRLLRTEKETVINELVNFF